ncbi:MAG: T9SS type A sorting domain-containing protein, partial [Bacteroidota bacterium]
ADSEFLDGQPDEIFTLIDTIDFPFTNEVLQGIDSIWNDPDYYNEQWIFSHFGQGNPEISTSYVKNLGRVRYMSNWYLDKSTNSLSIFLVYYFKTESGEEWGDRHNILSTKDKERISIELYPNPTDGIIQWEEQSELGKPGSATLFDLTGKQILQIDLRGQNNSLDLSSIDKGAYVLILEFENYTVSERVFLE